MIGPPRKPVRLLALDVDGTLLDHSGQLRPGIPEALRLASERGIRSVICTGRRYRRAAAIARQVGLRAPMVCNSGALLKDPETDQTLWRADLDPQTVSEVLRHFQLHGYPSVAFTDFETESHDFLVADYPTGRDLFDDYVAQNLEHARVEPGWQMAAGAGQTPHFHICAIGSHKEMLTLEQALPDQIRPRIQTFVQRSPRYTGWMCEVIRADANKWTAVCHLADRWGIAHSQICAIGDDQNDRAMIERSGFGVAMAHAPEPVRLAADWVLEGAKPDELASLIESFKPE